MIDVLAAAAAHPKGPSISTIAALFAAVCAAVAALIGALNSWRSTSYEQLLDDIEDIVRDAQVNPGQHMRRRRR